MPKAIRQTIISERHTDSLGGTRFTQMVENLVYFVFGLLEVFLLFRLLMKLFAANAANGFVSFVYRATNAFVAPFESMFRVWFGVEAGSVFEPASLVAIIVYALFVWAIVALLRVFIPENE